MPYSLREIAEQVRKMVAGEGVVFADLFAADGVLAYPFCPRGQPPKLPGREAIRAFFAQMGQSRELFDGPAPAQTGRHPPRRRHTRSAP
jgi:hypothetical protein